MIGNTRYQSHKGKKFSDDLGDEEFGFCNFIGADFTDAKTDNAFFPYAIVIGTKGLKLTAEQSDTAVDTPKKVFVEIESILAGDLPLYHEDRLSDLKEVVDYILEKEKSNTALLEKQSYLNENFPYLANKRAIDGYLEDPSKIVPDSLKEIVSLLKDPATKERVKQSEISKIPNKLAVKMSREELSLAPSETAQALQAKVMFNLMMGR